MTLFSMQLRAILLIFLVLIIRSLFLYKMPKKILLGLWLLVLARLFIPYSRNLSLGFSLPSIEGIWFSLIPVFTKIPGVESFSTTNTTGNVFTSLIISRNLYWIWLGGSLILATWFISGHLRGKRLYRFALPLESDTIHIWKEENKIWRKVQVLQCPKLSSALTYGIFRPVILLPMTIDLTNSDQLHAILSHEIEHIRHFDVLWKWLLALVICIYWYNPMVWVMYLLLNRDLELHCDECVLKKQGITKKNKSKYALTLLSLAEKKNRSFSTINYFSQSAIEERILSIMNSRYASYKLVGFSLLGIAILALLSFVSFVMEVPIGFTIPLQ